ncbi:MAG: hypothetical protein HY673_04815 [Chloroflexi bacterium]|nr:hypothetical protein [Chloroflexota bacterium]
MQKRAKSKPGTAERYVCDSRGRKRAVLLDLRVYNEMLEDLEDLRLLAERRNEPAIPLDEVEKRLKERGLL